MSPIDTFETLLRDRLRAEEPIVRPDPYLASSVIDTGSETLRRRHVRRTASTGALVAVLVAGAGVAALWSKNADSAAPSGPPSTGLPTTREPRIPVAAWAEQLPLGAGPTVPYIVGTTLFRPDGESIDLTVAAGSGDGLRVADAAIVGQTVAGLVLLVEDVGPGVALASRYVLVETDGDVVDMPVSTRTAGAAQEAVVSPDGRYFTNGGPVIDKQSGEVVAEMPEAAEYLHAWTPAGVLYSDHDSRFHLWDLGEAPVPVRSGNPGYFENGTDVGFRTHDGCTQVVRLVADGDVDPINEICLPPLMTLSPTGSYGLTQDLRVVDTLTGVASRIEDQPLGEMYAHADKFWEDDHTVLMSVEGMSDGSGMLVRCDVRERSCERATDVLPAGANAWIRLP